MNYKTIDSIVICYVIIQIKGPFVVNIACYIDSRSIPNVTLIPLAVVGQAISSMSWRISLEKGHEVAISIHYIIDDLVSTSANSFCENYSTRSTMRPPCVPIYNIVIKCDIIASITSNTRTGAVMDFII